MSILISIIMPVFNAETYIESAIMSVINQTFANWELILIDDGSTDSSAQVIQRMSCREPRIIYLYQENKKQAAARNVGLRHAKGDFIAFLDADDLWACEKLKIQIESLQTAKADICYSGGVIIDSNNKFQNIYPTIFGLYSGEQMYKRMYEYNPIPVMSVLMKKSVMDRIGLQDESPRMVGCEDFDFWLRIARTGLAFIGIDENLFSYRINPVGTSRGQLQMKMAECYALDKNFKFDNFTVDDLKRVYIRYLNLIRYIVPELIALRRHSEVPYYFELLDNITGLMKYKIAKLLFKFPRLGSTKLAKLFLYH